MTISDGGVVSPPVGKGALRPRARLLRTLGNDLISSDKVALIELVKNSYDADASTVLVRFHGPLEEGRGRIEVWDDGHGMDAITLQSSWLDIATDTKRRNPRSATGRRVLGEKGIGRLAAARLGGEMLLVTRMADSSEVKLFIDWSEFDREDAYLDEIEVVWDISDPDIFASEGVAQEVFAESESASWRPARGTVLQIDNLTHSWARDDVVELRTALTRLVRPRFSPDLRTNNAEPDFQIFLELLNVDESMLELAGAIEPSDHLRTPHYRLTGSVDEFGAGTFRYSQQEPELVQEFDAQLWNNDKRPPEVGSFELELDVWDRDKNAILRTLSTATASEAVPNAREIKGFRETLDEVAGLSIYRDGFRVLPFGERGDDWLGLDLRRVQSPTRRLSNNQIIGNVFIEADRNRGLRDQSNREGFLEGPAYADLQSLVRAALNQVEQRRYTARHPAKPRTEEKGGLFQTFDLGEIRDAIAASYPSDTRIIGLLDRKNQDIQEGVTEVQNVLSRYSRLATLGSLIDRVLHDGRTVVARIKNISRFGKRDLQKKNLLAEEKIEIGIRSMDDAAVQAGMLSTLFNQIEPFGGRKRGRPKEYQIDNVIRSAIAVLQVEADDKGVELVALEGGSSSPVRLDEAEVLAVLVNLIQNGIYWAATRSKGLQRSVAVGARRNADDSLTLIVSDTGPGVEPEVRGHIFDPYFSSKPEGVGLGLSIVGNIVEDIYGGELALVEDGPLDGATFEATFRRRV